MFRKNCLRCSTKVLLNNSQNSQEITCAKISLVRNFRKVENRCFPVNRCFLFSWEKVFSCQFCEMFWSNFFSLDASGWLLLIMSLTENILCFYRWIRIHFGFSWHNFYWDNDVNDKKLHTNNFPFFKRKHPSRGVPKIELKFL